MNQGPNDYQPLHQVPLAPQGPDAAPDKGPIPDDVVGSTGIDTSIAPATDQRPAQQAESTRASGVVTLNLMLGSSVHDPLD